MGKVINPDQLADEIESILNDYAGELDQHLGEAMQKVGRKGVQLLKNTSPKAKNSPHSGTYAKGWALSVENHRNLTHNAVIYNRHSGMPHLLENGHLLRNGKRLKGTEHIAPVAETLENEFKVEDYV